MRELSLFTGAGGGLLGTHFLLGWQCVGAVEWEEYPCRVLEARQRDGILPTFPIWHLDIREFNRRIAPGYSGMVDVITAGFPCQPFSLAGQQLGADDPRNQWPATIECIELVRPRYALLENVPGLLVSGYFGTVLGDLAEIGYGAKWRILSAAELGAPHQRNRLWIVAHDQHAWIQQRETDRRGNSSCNNDRRSTSNDRATRSSETTMADVKNRQHTQCHQQNWWSTEPGVGRVVYGMARRMDRIRALGNGQVPAVAAAAWRLLNE